MVHVPVALALVGYLLASILFLVPLLSKQPHRISWAWNAFTLGFLGHTLAASMVVAGHAGLIIERSGDYYFWVSWALGFGFLILRRRLNFPIIGALVAPSAILMLVSSSILYHQPGMTSDANPINLPLMAFHVAPALLAELSLLGALIVSIAFLIQAKRLKQKSITLLQAEGPSLELLDRWNMRFLAVAFVAMTFAVLSGAVWSYADSKAFLTGELRIWLTLISWGVMGLLLHTRHSHGFSMHRSSRLTVLLSGGFWLMVAVSLVVYGNALHG